MSYKDRWKQEDIDEEDSNEDTKQAKSPRVRFDYIVSLVGMLSVGVGIYTALDKRVLVLETNNSRQELRDITQDTDRLRISAESKEAFIDIKHGVERLSDKIDQLQVQQTQVQQDVAKKYKSR